MKEYSFSSISSELATKCHELNEKNVPNVGSCSLEGLTNSIKNLLKWLPTQYVMSVE